MSETDNKLILTEIITTMGCDISRLKQALWVLLDDMGKDGHCVCEESKQQAIEALGNYDG